MTPRLSVRDEQLLSEYLDGHLPEKEAASFAKRLESDPELRAAFSDLKHLKIILNHAPRYRPPRNFTLTPAMVKSQNMIHPAFWFPVMRFASIAAVFLLTAVFILEGLPGGIPAMRRDQLPAADPLTQDFSAEEAAPPGPPPIIIWNSPGEGRGGGADEPNVIQAAPLENQAGVAEEAPAEAQSMMAPAEPPDAPAFKEGVVGEAMEEPLALPPAAPATEFALPTMEPLSQDAQLQEPADAIGDGAESVPSILGIRPTQERAVITNPEPLSDSGIPPVDSSGKDGARKEINVWLWIKVILAFMALSTGTAALVLRKQTRI